LVVLAAIDTGVVDTVGIDLVAMCVNDVLANGAEPLFFLDYYATGKLDTQTATSVIRGIAEGCRQAGAALIGGETAEMPGMYEGNDFDLAGFVVGAAERDQMLPRHNDMAADDESLMVPTKIYIDTALPLIRDGLVSGLAHITGGGITDNTPRMLPKTLEPDFDYNAWPRPDVFKWLQETGHIDETEMRRAFNCGIGLVLCVKPADVDKVMAHLEEKNEDAWIIGTLKAA